MIETTANLAARRANAPSREDFLARFKDDGHQARLMFTDTCQPELEIICPHAARLRGSLTPEQRDDLGDAQCDDKVCWIREHYSDITWEALDIATWREDCPDDRWPIWSPSTAILRFLWRFEGFGEDAEFYFTLDDT